MDNHEQHPPQNNHDLDHDQDHENEDMIYGEEVLNYESGGLFCCTDNNPPDSYSVCETKVADWLNHNTFMERKASVKFACVNPCQTTRVSRRSVSLNQRAKLSIIGFKKKAVHHQSDHHGGKSNKHNDNNNKVENNVRLFRNRSEPGRDYCLLITEPVSPRVSCVGRVGSVRVQGRKQAGVWRSFKAAFSNMVHTNRSVAKIATV